MLFIEAERMANCVYDPADYESERTVIISELQGGENDPDTRIEQDLTAVAFSMHPYRHPTIGWLADLKTVSRDDLYRHCRRFYVPNNATLVIVGDVDTADAMRRVVRHFGRLRPGDVVRRPQVVEPRQLGERRLTLPRDGATAYLKLGYHAPAVNDPDFFPMLVLDAVLTGAKGLNLWASFQTPPSQRSSRLYRTAVDARLASSVMGALVPTAEPISVTATDGTPLAQVEEAVLAEIDRVRSDGVTEAELARATRQLRARLVFENDSITNIGHQLGYFETVAHWQITERLAGQIDAVTREQVGAAAAAGLTPLNRTVAWLEPSIDAGSKSAAASER